MTCFGDKKIKKQKDKGNAVKWWGKDTKQIILS
jgi:hypothetical protein